MMRSLLFSPHLIQTGINYLKNAGSSAAQVQQATADHFNCLLKSPFHRTMVIFTSQVFNEKTTLSAKWLHSFGLQKNAYILGNNRLSAPAVLFFKI